jgi:hypothetical protein
MSDHTNNTQEVTATMPRPRKLLMVSAGIALAAALASTSVAYATPPAGTVVTGNLKSGTDMTFVGKINGVAITVSCTTFTASATAPSTPSKTVDLNAPPTLSGCTDTLTGTDTVKTNSTNGPWEIETSGKKKITLIIPKAGTTFVSSFLPSCVITAAPKKAVKVSGKYDGTSSDTVSNAKIATSGSGCTSTTATTSATVVFSPAPGALPF